MQKMEMYYKVSFFEFCRKNMKNRLGTLDSTRSINIVLMLSALPLNTGYRDNRQSYVGPKILNIFSFLSLRRDHIFYNKF